MKKLFVLYDTQCPFCLRCRQWLGDEPAFVPLEFVPRQSPELTAQFPGIEAWPAKGELLVISDEGAVYQGASAFIICLYALKRYREWSLRLATPALAPLAARFFDLISTHRKELPRWLTKVDDTELGRQLETKAAPGCGDGLKACVRNG